MNEHELKFVPANWAAPAHVRALTTTRTGGFSRGPYASLNPAAHVGDSAEAVALNQRLLNTTLGLSSPAHWLTQVHGNRVVAADTIVEGIEADGSVTDKANVVCAVLTADCLPLFLCDRAGERVGLIHVGWRGLAAGIVSSGVRALAVDPVNLLAWMGPAIGPKVFEVGTDVHAALATDAEAAAAFRALPARDKWLTDLYLLTKIQLRRLGVKDINWDASLCTYSQPGKFFSYRRDGTCGRMASLIWKTR